VRIVVWNIRAGGGGRIESIRAALRRWRADVVALSEFRATPPSGALARALGTSGLAHQLTTCDVTQPGTNALLVASRWPLRRLAVDGAPADPCRWMLARIEAPVPFVLGVMHVPNRVTGRKYEFLDAVLHVVRTWRLGPALLAGDTNSGRRGLDEEVPVFNAREEGWIDALASAGWPDVFRALRRSRRAYTWYSPNGRNGFRIDQAFVNSGLLARVRTVRYTWARRHPGDRVDGISDHAALRIDLENPHPEELT
jgi:exonuclease III